MNTQEDKLQEGHADGRTDIQVEVGEGGRQTDRQTDTKGAERVGGKERRSDLASKMRWAKGEKKKI